MFTRSRLIAVSVLATAIVGGGTAAAFASQHEAKPESGRNVAAAQSGAGRSGCTSNAEQFQSLDAGVIADNHVYQWPTDSKEPRGEELAVTTGNCPFIGVKLTTDTQVRVCYEGTDIAPGECGTWRTAHANGWKNVELLTADDTHFYLQFDQPVEGYVAY
jgi:hypothetical protein